MARKTDGIGAEGSRGWMAVACAAFAAGTGFAQQSGLPPCGTDPAAPCPVELERPCAGTAGGGITIASACGCDCGSGWWGRRVERSDLFPARPEDSGPVRHSANLTQWTWSTGAQATPGRVEAEVSVMGNSTFWHSGSLTRSATAQQATVEREEWTGRGIPCPRAVSLAAMGGAMLELSMTCSPSVGCAASGSVTVAASCSSAGEASAQITDKTVHGTVGYRSYEHSVVAEGRFGASIEDDSVGIDGRISSKVQWQLSGDGSVSGSAAYVVTPDRAYCAFTNRAITLRSNGTAIATGGATVDNNGSASMSGLAIASLSVF